MDGIMFFWVVLFVGAFVASIVWVIRDTDGKSVVAPVLLTFAPFLLIALFGFGSGISYGEGDRIGFVVKISNKGLIWKTWEGMMQTGGISPDSGGSVSANMWEFSVSDEKVVKQLSEAMQAGHRVQVHYREYVLRGPSHGGTGYTIYEVM